MYDIHVSGRGVDPTSPNKRMDHPTSLKNVAMGTSNRVEVQPVKSIKASLFEVTSSE
jgi:hypothetical protein